MKRLVAHVFRATKKLAAKKRKPVQPVQRPAWYNMHPNETCRKFCPVPEHYGVYSTCISCSGFDSVYSAGEIAEAVDWHLKAAGQGDAEAQANLGVMYANGRGVAKDEAEAAKWYRSAAEQGVVSAQFNLGVLYEDGLGVARDAVEAAMWYRKAAEQGFAHAQFNLGTMYEVGLGVAQDEAEALKWYRKAARQGDAYAQRKLKQRADVSSPG